MRLYSSRMCCAVAAFSWIVTAAGVLMAVPDVSVVMKEGWDTSLGALVGKESPTNSPGAADEGNRNTERGSPNTLYIARRGGTCSVG